MSRLVQIGKYLKKEEELAIKDSKIISANNGFELTLTFPSCIIDRVHMCEDTTKSQRVERFSLWAKGKKIYSGTVIGFSKIAIFEPLYTDKITLVIDQCRKEPYIEKFTAVKRGAYRL